MFVIAVEEAGEVTSATKLDTTYPNEANRRLSEFVQEHGTEVHVVLYKEMMRHNKIQTRGTAK